MKKLTDDSRMPRAIVRGYLCGKAQDIRHAGDSGLDARRALAAYIEIEKLLPLWIAYNE